MATFFKVLFFCCSILRIQRLNHLTDSGMNFLIAEDFLYRIYKENIEIAFKSQHMLLLAPALADTALEKITLDCSLEEFL